MTADEMIETLQEFKIEHPDYTVGGIWWAQEDVLAQLQDRGITLTEVQQKEAVELVKRHADVISGITWDTIDFFVDHLIVK